jgi:hypothetical protein
MRPVAASFAVALARTPRRVDTGPVPIADTLRSPLMSTSGSPDMTKLTGTDALRAVAEAMFRVRAGLEHGDIEGARHAARHLVIALDALPLDKKEYEALCDQADKELESNPSSWNEPTGA